ncbi:hypothetical protein SCHPADRAFT_742682 [Schizopora paradoxa]|uniref:Uncharacterized protein n=1 Tax=Schizopora paradoxa TaxID=27342 RepID=A0A0H2RJH7_9AGAM|nr:hypothetical protein SCHPADRAFT_742682 [Schizopora paradoxa]
MPNGTLFFSTTTTSPVRSFPSRVHFCLGPTMTTLASGQQNSLAYSPKSRTSSKPFASALSDKLAASSYYERPRRLSPRRFAASHRHQSPELVVSRNESRHADG